MEVYTVNAETNEVETWSLVDKFETVREGVPVTMCVLAKDKKKLILPKRCVFATREEAEAVKGI